MNKLKLKIKEFLLSLSIIIPDKIYLKLIFFYYHKRILDLKEPKSFNEKLQWLKLNYRPKTLTILVDKYRVRDYISKTIGREYLIPLLGVWERPEDINFEELPNKFVLKCNHDSGSVFICLDKSNIDKEKIKDTISKQLKTSLFPYGREWAYKNVIPCIIAEKYMVDESGFELKDYKFFCFNGKAEYLLVASDRQTAGEEVKFDFFDMNYNRLPFKNMHPISKSAPSLPSNIDEMRRLAEKLSKGFPHVRIDLYNINKKIYFGEFTFYHGSGFMPISPYQWDEKIGRHIDISKL